MFQQKNAELQSYIGQENGVVSLKRFVAYAPKTVLICVAGTKDPKDFCNMSFKIIISEQKITNYSNEQLDWLSLGNQSTNKGSREQSTPSSSSGSSSAVTTTTTETTSKRRKKLTTFLSEKISPVVTLDTDIAKWEVEGESVSELLLKYREVSIQKAQQGTLIAYQEEMSINGIFLIYGLSCVAPSSQLEYGFEQQTWEAVVHECATLYPVEPLPNATENHIRKLAKIITTDYQECKSILNGMPDSDEHIIDSLRNMLSLYSPKASNKANQLESTFSLTAVHPLILPFLEESDLTHTDRTDRKTKKGSDHAGKRGYQFADLSVTFEYDVLPEQTLLAVEIKAPHKVRTGSRPDLVKLANEMKDSMDKMISGGMDERYYVTSNRKRCNKIKIWDVSSAIRLF